MFTGYEDDSKFTFHFTATISIGEATFPKRATAKQQCTYVYTSERQLKSYNTCKLGHTF